MDSLIALLDAAKAAGLVFQAKGDRLVVQGPGSGEPIARQLLERKSEVLEAIKNAERVNPIYPAATANTPASNILRYETGPYAGFFYGIGQLDPIRSANCLREAEDYCHSRDAWIMKFRN